MRNNTKDVSTSNPRARSEKLLVQNSENELLVYDLNSNRAICLNETSAFVWKNCDGTNTIEDLTNKLGANLGQKVGQELVWFALDQLHRENLLTRSQEFAVRFPKFSRREIIRKVGLSSMIALPIVSSLVAPQSFHAQTCVGGGANFPMGQQTAAGTYPGGVCDPMDGVGICAGQGANCCTGVAEIMCTTPGAAPFTCNCT